MFELVIFLALSCFLFTVLRGAPFVPSKKKYVKQAFKDLYTPRSGDVLLDIGSGTGTVLKASIDLGFKKTIGFELNPLLVLYSRLYLYKYAKDKRVKIYYRDFLLAKIPEGITFFYCFGVENFVEKALIKIQDYSNSQNREIYFMSLAFKSSAYKPERSNGLYYLYKISPCKKAKP